MSEPGDSSTVTVDSCGRITIPKKMRLALHVAPGRKIDFTIEGDALVGTPRRLSIDDLAGSVPTPPWMRGLTDQEIRELALQTMVDEYARKNPSDRNRT